MTKGMVLNYGQAMILGGIEDKIKSHIKLNYTEMYYGSKNILGRIGHSFSKTTWDKLIKLSNTDATLQTLINEFNVELSKIKDEVGM